ncbi:MAG TPA: M1 family metallopeptidase [Gammaproteobacteria bacterium]|nr:M1 family metallopeptidase [Gammaproteobacteria bacterium]
MRKRIIAPLLAAFFAGAASAQLDSAPQEPDVLGYVARVEPSIDTKSVKGTVTIRIDTSAALAAPFAFDAGDLVVDSVREAGRDVPFVKLDRRLVVTLPAPRRPADRREIEIAYHGTPRRGITFVPDPQQIYTAFSTSDWLPCIDAPRERAMLDLTVVVPADFVVAGSGRAAGAKRERDRVASRWVLARPMPCYLFGFAAGRFSEASDRAGDVELRYLGPPALTPSQLRDVFAATGDMLEFFAGKAGIDYSGNTYTQVLTGSGSGQELAAMALLGERYGRGVLSDPKSIWLGAHEAAHQWWGNSVTNESWSHFWLNEGVATFMTAAYLEHRFGHDEYVRQIDGAKAKYEALRAAGKDKPLVFEVWSNPSADDRSIVYDKGAYVIHLLREELGEDAFWPAFARYTQRYWGRPVTTEDFRAAMEEASGRDLEQFFARWVYGSDAK